MSAIRNARSDSLCREPIENTGHNFLSLARAQFRQGRVDWRFPAYFRMRRSQKTPRMLAILPNILGHGHYPRQALCSSAFSRAQKLPPPFVGGLRNDAMHHRPLFGRIRKNTPRYVAEGRFRQASLDG